MTGSRSSRRDAAGAWIGAASIVLALGSTVAATDAQGGPIQAVPLSSGIDAAAAGALDPSAAGLPATLWQGSERETSAGLIATLPARFVSPSLRDLVRRALAVAAPPPHGPPITPGFAEGRGAALLAMGDARMAGGVLAAIPRTQRTEMADRLLLDASLLAQDRSSACAVARDRNGRSDAPVFGKTAAFCEALAGDRARAELVAALVAERAPDDDAFFQLLDLATGAATKPGKAVQRLETATPLHLAMLRAVGLPPPGLPEDPDAPYALAVEAMVAVDPAAGLDLRTAAAWRAFAANAADAGAVRQLFLAAGGQAKGKAPQDRIARLLTEAAGAPDGPDRALALARLLDAGAELEALAPVARLAGPMLVRLLPVASGPDIAGRIARGLLLAGETAQARRWLASLQRAGAVPGAAEEAARLRELLTLAAGHDARTFGGVEAGLWLGEMQRAYANADDRVALLGRLRAALGYATPPVMPTGSEVDTRLSPLMAAAATGRVGEAVLRAALLVEATDDSAPTRPARMTTAVHALLEAGLDAEARRLAVEAAIAGGL